MAARDSSAEMPAVLAELTAISQAIVDATDTVVLVLEESGRIRYANPACEKLTGYSAGDLVGRDLFEVLIPEEDREAVRAYWEPLWQGRASSRHQNPWLTKEGERLYLAWSNAIVEAEDGKRYAVATGEDLTRQRKLERDIVHVSESERQRIGQEVHDTLASDLVVASMRMENLLDRMQSGTMAEPEIRSRLEQIQRSVEEGADRARSLSHLLGSRTLAPTDLSETLAEMIDTYQEISAPHIRLHTRGGMLQALQEGTTAMHVYRIAQEAVRNAIRHSNAEHVDVYLHFEGASPTRSTGGDAQGNSSEPPALFLHVRDDGTGLPEHALADTRPPRPGGTNRGPADRSWGDGIGLDLMRYRADLIGADLSFHTTEGEGTEVRCRLPLS